ncbi:putative sugar transferase EpsL [Tritonibacter multivorans]|uniref:Putative sugar transferase EpsL n=2 Tax=Tritonibacter multivorans TaxID=928856 RepID=A0A0P1GX62_9RHOB|nr:putative sugar transferase EpsL [Tritonibacter multivorans]SFD18154.1 Sugar transferase involved in LPS biosynthesis (colanic, teichoic acid) [Tritonibacter multivorans]
MTPVIGFMGYLKMQDFAATNQNADALPILGGEHPRGFYASFGKRVFDITAVLCAAPLVLLLVVPLMLLIARDGGSPFYTQMRIGRNGKEYRMWKLRSMVVGADEKLAQYLAENPDAKAEWDQTQKLKSDPRITTVGRLIRKTSLDELPQLWNVLIGEMSLVGPRPMMPCQKRLYPGQDYYDLRPGITGAWQVSERNESFFSDRASYDSSYKSNLSAKTDALILFKTVGVVCKATGH